MEKAKENEKLEKKDSEKLKKKDKKNLKKYFKKKDKKNIEGKTKGGKVHFRPINLYSIKTKLIFYFALLLILSSLSMGMMGVKTSRDTLISETENNLVSLAYNGAKLTKSMIDGELKTIGSIANREDIETMNWDIQLPALNHEIKGTNFLDMAVVDMDGNAKYIGGDEVQLGDREYVRRALSGEANVSDIMESRVIDDVVLMFATPIRNKGRVVGALIGRRHVSALSQILDSTGFGNTGYRYMINRDGKLVAHPNRSLVLSGFNPIEDAKEDPSLESISSFFQEIISDRRGVSHYNYEGENLYGGFAPIEGSNWMFVYTINENEALASVIQLKNTIIKSGVVVLFISIVVTYLIGTSIVKPILKLAHGSKKIVDLDISEDIDADFLKKKDEIGELSRAFQNIIDNLRHMVKEVNGSSQQVASASQQLMATSQESAVAAEEVTKVVEEIARGANEQALNTEQGSNMVTELGQAIEDNGEYVDGLNNAAEKVVKIIEEGLIQVENLSEITRESEIALGEIREIILKTNESSNEIGDASGVIASIAAQTNLLALNAAIEAARAGEAGRGFTVVAEEIRKLAEQSSQSTTTIDEIVNELQNSSQNAVKAMERVSVIAGEQIKSVEGNKDKYIGVNDAIGFVSNIADKLNESSKRMEGMKDEIVDILQNLTAIAEENSASTEEASASMEELAASTGEISGSTEGLAELAQDLQGLINRFKL